MQARAHMRGRCQGPGCWSRAGQCTRAHMRTRAAHGCGKGNRQASHIHRPVPFPQPSPAQRLMPVHAWPPRAASAPTAPHTPTPARAHAHPHRSSSHPFETRHRLSVSLLSLCTPSPFQRLTYTSTPSSPRHPLSAFCCTPVHGPPLPAPPISPFPPHLHQHQSCRHG